MKRFIVLIVFYVSVSGCIKDYFLDDFIEPKLVISNAIDTIAIGESYQMEYKYFNNVGQEDVLLEIEWVSSANDIISISSTGEVEALKSGSSAISISALVDGKILRDEVTINTGVKTSEAQVSRSGVLRTTSQYLLKGSYVLTKQDDGTLILSFADDFEATTALPELHGFLSNNPNSFQGAYDLGPTNIFKGAHSFVIGSEVSLNTYAYLTYWCVPFSVKVGDGELK